MMAGERVAMLATSRPAISKPGVIEGHCARSCKSPLSVERDNVVERFID